MTFLGVLGQRQGHEAIEIDVSGVGDIGHVEPAVQRFLGQPGGERRQLGQPFGDCRRLRDQLGVRHQPLGEAEAKRFFRCHRISHGHLHRLALPDPSGQPNNPAVVRQYAQSDLRQPPLGAIGSDDQIAAISDDAADADCIAVDRGDDRLGKFTQHLASRAMALG